MLGVVELSKLHLDMSTPCDGAESIGQNSTITVKELFLLHKFDASPITPLLSNFVGVEKLDMEHCLSLTPTSNDMESGASLLSDILKLYPKVRSVNWRGTVLTFKHNLQGQRMEVEIEWGESDMSFVEEMCAVIDVPIVKCCFLKEVDVYVDDGLLMFIAEEFGSDLRSLCFATPESEMFSIDDDTLIDALSLCPNLHQLFVFCASLLTRKSLHQLPILCPQITSLGLAGHSELTDDDAVWLLEAFQKNDMKILRFDACTNLTNITMLRIVEVFSEE